MHLNLTGFVKLAQIYARHQPQKNGTGPLIHDTSARALKLQRIYAAKLSTLRFVAICSIVWGHSLFGGDNGYLTAPGPIFLQAVMLEFGRLGTIIFFIISGFFLADKIGQHNVRSYLWYRRKSIIIPWAIFVFACFCMQFLQLYSFAQLRHERFVHILSVTINLLSGSIFYAAYWFIPVSIISACVLILAKKFVFNGWFAVLLSCIAWFYCINLYYGWIDVNHTKSILGYTFFILLGVWFKKNVIAVNKLINRVRWRVLLVLILFAFIASCMEGIALTYRGCKDPFASIRFSNIILSLLLIVAFLKNRSLYFIKKLRPEKYVYGVYLVHSLVLLQLMPYMSAIFKKYALFHNALLYILLQVLFFTIVITSSYIFSVMIKNSRLRFLTGR